MSLLVQLNRRALILGALLLPAVGMAATPNKPLIEVWKDPSCGCCKDWIAVLEKAGFPVKLNDTGNNGVRAQFGMPAKLGSCHTARAAGYVLEGHVPVREIERLLREKPDAIGLTVPGMKVGSPGMDGPIYKGRKDPYSVLLVRRDGSTTVYQQYS
ncbi:DUF411 domain-containing protein [Rhodoferax sp.]|uniref:DUF411 domain-containing protein n=1 Tax=Rhodoferax sp. TaxID=50421 RepID=UPI001A01EE57|nr:DUF411 domain-containing protein [Rhodoferax sp.]MBE0474139.1 DUF411 domain-containing protein [Rhodoferax sp.]